MILKPLTDGSTSGTGLLACNAAFGGALITADGTNDATVIVRRNSDTGTQIFKVVTKASGLIAAPFDLGDSNQIHYSISGTGAAAQLYEWVD